MRFEFRFARSSDAAAVWALRTQAIRLKCSSHYPADVIESWATAEMPSTFGALIENEHFVVAEQDGRIVGYAGLKPTEQEIEAIFVSPDFSGQGLGALLLQRAEKQEALHPSRSTVSVRRTHLVHTEKRVRTVSTKSYVDTCDEHIERIPEGR